MIKKAMLVLAIVGAFNFATATDANAWVVHRRVAPVRRAVAGTARVAGRVAFGPRIYRAPAVYVAPAPVYYGPGVYVW